VVAATTVETDFLSELRMADGGLPVGNQLVLLDEIESPEIVFRPTCDLKTSPEYLAD
jgi:hypothetical protein